MAKKRSKKQKEKKTKKINNTNAQPVGRPTDYSPEYAEQVCKLCMLGATDKELAGFFGVSEVTLNAWKKARPEFLKSMQAGKMQADAEVAESLYKRAKGYEHNAVKIFADPKTGSEHVVSYIERYPPDTAAASLWLRNRQPDKWRDKQEHEHSGPKGGPIETKSDVTISPDEAYRRMLDGPARR